MKGKANLQRGKKRLQRSSRVNDQEKEIETINTKSSCEPDAYEEVEKPSDVYSLQGTKNSPLTNEKNIHCTNNHSFQRNVTISKQHHDLHNNNSIRVSPPSSCSGSNMSEVEFSTPHIRTKPVSSSRRGSSVLTVNEDGDGYLADENIENGIICRIEIENYTCGNCENRDIMLTTKGDEIWPLRRSSSFTGDR